MTDNAEWIEVDGVSVRTLRDILPEPPGLRALIVAKTPALVSVERGHYFQGTQGRMFWNMLRRSGVLKPTTTFEDDSLLMHGYGITDIVKVPRDYGSEPSASEYAAGIDRILDLVRLHHPSVLIFVYKGVLDEVLRQRFRRPKAAYGFNPDLDALFGARVFVFPMPGTPCPKATADRAMQELAAALIGDGLLQPAVAVDVTSPSAERVVREPRVQTSTARELAEVIVTRLAERGYAQAPGLSRFGYLGRSGQSILVSRERGQDTPIPMSRIEAAVVAVQQDPSVYHGGPSRLRKHGITFVNSVLYALLHLLSPDELRSS